MRLSPTCTVAAERMRTEGLLWMNWRRTWELIQSVDHVVAVVGKARLRSSRGPLPRSWMLPRVRPSLFKDSALCFHSSHCYVMIVALRFIRRHSDTIGHHISFFLTIFSFDTKHVTGYHVPSSSLVHLDILFDDNTLSHKSVGSWKISLAIWIDPDAWMWSFDDEDASRDATKKARQIYLFSIYLILRFLVDNTFLLLQDHHNIFSSTPRPCSIGVVVSFAIILLLCRQESLRRSPREETVHTATISTAEKGHHVSFGLEGEDEADLARGSDIALLAPIMIETRVQQRHVPGGMSQLIVLMCMHAYAA